MTATAPPPHPAKWSKELLPHIAEVLAAEFGTDPWEPPRILDPFAGVGLDRLIATYPQAEWHGVELEPEWAAVSERTVVGDVMRLDELWSDPYFDAVVSSPAYGNRMADCHEARDACKTCDGSGCSVPGCPDDGHVHTPCKNCKGAGLSDRLTYRHKLGRMPTTGSSAVLQWGKPYRDFHLAADVSILGRLNPGGLIVWNVANHPRDQIEQRVVEWHLSAWLQLGCTVDHVRFVGTRKARKGANHTARIEGERLLVLRAPDKAGML